MNTFDNLQFLCTFHTLWSWWDKYNGIDRKWRLLAHFCNSFTVSYEQAIFHTFLQFNISKHYFHFYKQTKVNWIEKTIITHINKMILNIMIHIWANIKFIFTAVYFIRRQLLLFYKKKPSVCLYWKSTA